MAASYFSSVNSTSASVCVADRMKLVGLPQMPSLMVAWFSKLRRVFAHRSHHRLLAPIAIHIVPLVRHAKLHVDYGRHPVGEAGYLHLRQ